VHPTFNQSDSVRQRYAFGELADDHKILSQRNIEMPCLGSDFVCVISLPTIEACL
jgi:hypothetical protein